jgi:ATP-binding cassette subfamily B (MDR/TAP) protein 1
MVEQGHATSGEVMNVVLAILIGAFSIAMIAPELQSISKGRAAATKLFETIDRDPTINSANPGGLRPEKVDGNIAFEDVVFHYPSRPNVPVLKGLSTTFGSGDTCALVGASGSGKSTVIQLLERFYDPIGGRITLDGVDIRDLNLKWLRQQMGYVAQEPVLFATSVRGNVEHGLIGSKWENAPDAERLQLVKKACEAANADGFISKLPQGYDTHVGERGMLLSGGQKQRVAIARAIVSDPRILLLDEATSALDGQSERVVQDALEKASVGRTTIVIAHRLATVKDADRIIVMGAGEIVEQGTHNSLLEDKDGAYFTLVQNQQLQQKAAEKAADESESESEDEGANPLQRHISPELYRQHTHGNRSLASLALEQRRMDVAAYSAPYDKAGFFPLFWRLLKVNRKHWKLYIPGVIGATAAGMVYPCISILFGKTISTFELPRGTHDQLIAKGGAYADLVAMQVLSRVH